MEKVSSQFEVKAVDDVEAVDESTLKETVGGLVLSPVTPDRLGIGITPIRLRPIDLVMGKTTLF